jgi:hypothetical protein
MPSPVVPLSPSMNTLGLSLAMSLLLHLLPVCTNPSRQTKNPAEIGGASAFASVSAIGGRLLLSMPARERMRHPAANAASAAFDADRGYRKHGCTLTARAGWRQSR